MQAMFTGAETVAWWTMVGNKKANVGPQRVSVRGLYRVLLIPIEPCSP